MNNQQIVTTSQLQEASQEDDFRYYARPLTAKLLETMELSKYFIKGEGDYLYYQKKNHLQRVLDLTGGYGANILGHRHPKILSKVKEWQESGSPSLTQGSQRRLAGELARKISQTLEHETSEGPWVTTFSNSGAEAVEAAYKHSLMYFQKKLTQIQQEIEKEINQALIKMKSLSDSDCLKLVNSLRDELSRKISGLLMKEERKSYYLHQISNIHSSEDLASLIREINQLQLEHKPHFLALEKSYHGKTMGALSLTYNESFRNAFYLDNTNNSQTTFVSQYIEQSKLQSIIEGLRQDLIFLGVNQTGVSWVKHTFSLLAAAFVEPIQGEAGVIPVNPDFLALLKKHSLQENYLLIFDEIQSGMYRTGTLSAGVHSHITADAYTFSKSLGGGIAKIAATTINHKKYVEEFGFLHTSTFAEDDFSSAVALEVLDILQGKDSPVQEGLKVADYLSMRLDQIRSKFPEVIREVRGIGMMLAVEFHDCLAEMGFEFKTICDSRMQGYMLASALLNHENIRMSPSLSNNLTLRIQPSLFFGIVQAEELIAGLENLCHELKEKNLVYFLSCIYPDQPLQNIQTPQLKINFERGKRPLSVFLCHLIDETHIRKVSKALRGVETKTLLYKLSLTKDLADFKICHAQTIVDQTGQEMDVIMLGVPVTSEELKNTFMSEKKHKVISKVQAAVDYAKELGASTVGLGQFSSIVSGNGLYLNPRGMNLTTGNAYTISLAVTAALRSARDKKIDLNNASVSLIGSAGNIMSIATSLMADHVRKLILVHHTPLEASPKFMQTTKKILDEISQSIAESEVTKVVRQLWKGQDLGEFLALEEVKKVFITTSDMTSIKESEIVLCGASASNGFLSPEMFREDAVIVDVAVPPSIKPELLNQLKSERPDLTYHLGGVAQIPKNQSIEFFLMPLGKNECFACMAETFSLGFSGQRNFLNIGDLNKKVVLEVETLASKAGFTLGSYKSKSSL
jgi:acetylornithine/succinyldiaminopimelate/putrescine aminotransferase/predicted amino acid dehydrogenase